MGRPREFDVEEALDRIADVFWASGYAGTSIRDLERAVGLGRGSLFAAYGDKHALYLAALDRYRSRQGVAAVGLIETAESDVDAIRGLLFAATREARGCFLVAATCERAGCDPTVAERAAASRAGGERMFADLLRSAVAKEELPADTDIVGIARFLSASVGGLKVAAQAGAGVEELRSIAEVAMRAVR